MKLFLIDPSPSTIVQCSCYRLYVRCTSIPPCCSSACAIELGEQVVVTGGSFSHDLVTLYNQQVTSHSDTH